MYVVLSAIQRPVWYELADDIRNAPSVMSFRKLNTLF